jgi:hypothetical protein
MHALNENAEKNSLLVDTNFLVSQQTLIQGEVVAPRITQRVLASIFTVVWHHAQVKIMVVFNTVLIKGVHKR